MTRTPRPDRLYIFAFILWGLAATDLLLIERWAQPCADLYEHFIAVTAFCKKKNHLTEAISFLVSLLF